MIPDDTIQLPGKANLKHQQITNGDINDGSEAIGGHMQDLETDDNPLDANKTIGLDINAGEMSQPEVNSNEEMQRGQDEYKENQ